MTTDNTALPVGPLTYFWGENGSGVGGKVLANTKLDTSVYTPADILAKIKTVDGTGSGLDADTVRGTTPGSVGLGVLSATTQATARQTLGLGTAALAAATDFVTPSAFTSGLAGKVSTSLTINSKPLMSDVTLAKGDIGLGNVDNTSDADKPVSTLQAAAIAARIPYYSSGAALPSSDIGPIWHADYAAIMTWDGVGYASVGVGESRMFAFNAIPAGHLAENGAAVSRTAYAGLFRRIGTTWGAGDGSTTFNLPDSRAEWVRGFDSGRGVDSGRVFAAWQGEMIGPHYHPTKASTTGYTGGNASVLYAAGDNNGTVTFGGTAGSNGVQSNSGSENRVRNQTRLFCIKF